MVDDDDAAIAAAPTRVVDDAVAGGAHGSAVCRLKVGAFVRADDAGDGVDTGGVKRRADVVVVIKRDAVHRHFRRITFTVVVPDVFAFEAGVVGVGVAAFAQPGGDDFAVVGVGFAVFGVGAVEDFDGADGFVLDFVLQRFELFDEDGIEVAFCDVLPLVANGAEAAVMLAEAAFALDDSFFAGRGLRFFPAGWGFRFCLAGRGFRFCLAGRGCRFCLAWRGFGFCLAGWGCRFCLAGRGFGFCLAGRGFGFCLAGRGCGFFFT